MHLRSLRPLRLAPAGLVALCALAPALPSAPADAAAAKPLLALPTIDTFTLANGLQVAVMPVEGAKVAAIHVWYHAGSKDEPRDRRGSAHMFEHMMFRGTAHVAPEHAL